MIIYGTRPEEIKLYPIWKALGCKALYTKQSPDLSQDLITPDYTSSPEGLKIALASYRPRYVIVQGDTRTAFYAALTAFELQIPVVHIEAGLRSWDLAHPFPEEGYRRMISEIASVHFCPTERAAANLAGREHVYVVGNTSLDTLKEFLPKTTRGKHVIVTIHRKETNIRRMAAALRDVKTAFPELPLHIYAHPNQHGAYLKRKFKTLPPLPYDDFIYELASCRFIISDSGGIQEEAPTLNKPLIIARETTERPEILETGGAILAGYDLTGAVKTLLQHEENFTHSSQPFGSGESASLIKSHLEQIFTP